MNKLRKPLYKRWWFWVLCGIASVIVSIAGLSALAGGNTGSSFSKIGYMKEATYVGDLKVTVTDAYNTKSISSISGPTEYNYVVVTIKVANEDNEEKTFYSSYLTYVSNGNKYEVSSEGIYLNNGMYVYEKIGAGMSKTINVVFEIPQKYSDDDYLIVKDGVSEVHIYMHKK